MKKLLIFAFALVVCSLGGCGKDAPPEEAAMQSLCEALRTLAKHDYDAYLANADIDCEMDSFHLAIMKQVLAQHQESQEAQNGALVDVRCIDAKMVNDTVCTVYYQLIFADSTTEASSQKMIHEDGAWKIRLRN